VSELKAFPVFDQQGAVGELLATARFLDDRPEKLLRLHDGTEVVVPAEALEVRPDGSYYLHGSVAQLPRNPNQSGVPENTPRRNRAPITTAGDYEPQPDATKPTSSVGHPTERSVDEQFFRDGYEIEHVRVERFIDAPAGRRTEGETIIFPVMEEVLVIEKKLMLVEEVRITPRRERLKDVRTISDTPQGKSDAPRTA
jgi:hypothetical protein